MFAPVTAWLPRSFSISPCSPQAKTSKVTEIFQGLPRSPLPHRSHRYSVPKFSTICLLVLAGFSYVMSGEQLSDSSKAYLFTAAGLLLTLNVVHSSKSRRDGLMRGLLLTSVFLRAAPKTNAQEMYVSDWSTVSTTPPDYPLISDLAQTASNTLVHVWDENKDTKRAVTNLAGEVIVPAVLLLSGGHYQFSRVAALGEGKYTILAVNMTDPEWRVIHRIFGSDHSPIGPFVETLPNAPGKQSDPDIKQLANGQVMVTATYDRFFYSIRGASVPGVAYQGYDAEMTTPSSSFKGNCFEATNDHHAHGKIVPKKDGSFVCLADAQNANEILVSRISPSNVRTTITSPKILPRNQYHPVGLDKPNGYTQIAWAATLPEDHNGVADVFFKRYDALNTPIAPIDGVSVPQTFFKMTHDWTRYRNGLDIVNHPLGGTVVCAGGWQNQSLYVVDETNTLTNSYLDVFDPKARYGIRLAPITDGWVLQSIDPAIRMRTFTLEPILPSTTITEITTSVQNSPLSLPSQTGATTSNPDPITPLPFSLPPSGSAPMGPMSPPTENAPIGPTPPHTGTNTPLILGLSIGGGLCFLGLATTLYLWTRRKTGGRPQEPGSAEMNTARDSQIQYEHLPPSQQDSGIQYERFVKNGPNTYDVVPQELKQNQYDSPESALEEGPSSERQQPKFV